MSYKTLILIDNSNTVTTLNREILKETVKYLLINGEDNTKFSIATVSNGIDILADYDDTKETKVRSLDKMEYHDNVDSSLDAVMKVVQEYRDCDLAERDIILISDGHREEGSYTAEELFFELNDTAYPVYVLCCDQSENKSELRELSSIARISGGKSFHTNIEGGEADIEAIIGNEILSSLSERHCSMESYDELNGEALYNTYSDEYGSQYYDENYVNPNDGISQYNDKIMVENSYLMDGGYNAGNTGQNLIYDYQVDSKRSSGKAAFILPIIIILCLIIVVMIISSQRRKRAERKKEELFINSIRATIDKKTTADVGGKESINDIVSEMDEGATRSLSFDEYDDEEGGTRLLYQAVDGVDITLEDRADPTKYFRTQIRDRIVLGRSQKLCDVPINYDDSVSSRHCELFLRCEELFVRDLSSSNGTYVNGQKVYQEIKINSGDILKLGQLSLYIQILRRGGFA